jgi:hypothetical protein
MSIPVDLSKLAEVMAGYRFAYLLVRAPAGRTASKSPELTMAAQQHQMA